MAVFMGVCLVVSLVVCGRVYTTFSVPICALVCVFACVYIHCSCLDQIRVGGAFCGFLCAPHYACVCRRLYACLRVFARIAVANTWIERSDSGLCVPRSARE